MSVDAFLRLGYLIDDACLWLVLAGFVALVIAHVWGDPPGPGSSGATT